jgi:hypothetical protein
MPLEYCKNRPVSEQEFSYSIIGIGRVDGNSLCLPVPPYIVSDCTPPSFQLLDSCFGNMSLIVKRKDCGLIAEYAKICLDNVTTS